MGVGLEELEKQRLHMVDVVHGPVCTGLSPGRGATVVSKSSVPPPAPTFSSNPLKTQILNLVAA